MNSPQPTHHARTHGSGGNTKTDASSLNIAEAIQAYMANPRGNMLYGGADNSLTNPYPSYQQSMTTGPDSGYNHSAAQYASYGSVSYPNSNMADVQSMDTRRRAIEALNDFLGDIKRRALNPGNYYDVGQRLQSANALPLPIATGSGYSMGYNGGSGGQSNYNNGFSNSSLMEIFGQAGSGNMHSAGMHGAVSQPGYALPMSNARTKTDLQDIDRFLEQLQSTVYESSHAAAAAGVQQPGIHTQFANDYNFGGNTQQMQYRSSHSPTTQSSHSISGSASGVPVTSAALDTPALTPASISSYSSSGHSPLSSAGRPSMSSAAMYPSLPSVTGMDMSSGYPSNTSAPTSGLSTSFDDMEGRRYSGGRLQRQAPASEADVEMEDGAATPRPKDAPTPKADASLDPALRAAEEDKKASEAAAVRDESAESDDKRQEEWVENIRVIEALRKWVNSRLKNGEFEGSEAANDDNDNENGDDADKMDVDKKEDEDSKTKPIESAQAVEEKMAEALTKANAEHDTPAKAAADEAVAYPTLPTA